MLEVKVYGPGCERCKETEKRVRHVIEEAGIQANVTHATDFAEMAKAGIMMTPAVSVNGVIKKAGNIPSEEEIKRWLTTE